MVFPPMAIEDTNDESMLTGPSMMQLPCRQSIIQQVWYQVLAHSQASNQYSLTMLVFAVSKMLCLGPLAVSIYSPIC